MLPSALPKLNTAFRVGQPVLRRSVDLNEQTAKVFDALDKLVQNPNTGLGLQDLRTLTSVTAPALAYIAPYQIVCSDFNYVWEGLAMHQDEQTGAGTAERVLLRDDGPNTQNGKFGDIIDSRSADVAPSQVANGNTDPTTAVLKTPPNPAVEKLNGTPFVPAVDAQGNADCENGQFGWVDGPLNPPYTRQLSGGYGTRNTVTLNSYPTLAGPTWDGVKNLKDVP